MKKLLWIALFILPTLAMAQFGGPVFMYKSGDTVIVKYFFKTTKGLIVDSTGKTLLQYMTERSLGVRADSAALKLMRFANSDSVTWTILKAGANITLTMSANKDTVTIASTGGSGTFKGIKAWGSTLLADSAKLSRGFAISIAQAGDSLIISLDSSVVAKKYVNALASRPAVWSANGDTLTYGYVYVNAKDTVDRSSGSYMTQTQRAADSSGHNTRINAINAQFASYAPLAGAVGWTTIHRSDDTTYAVGAASFVDLGQLEFDMASSGFYEIYACFFVVRATAANGYTLALNLTQAVTNCAILATAQGIVTAGYDMMRTEPITDYRDSLQLTTTTVTTGDVPAILNGWILNTNSTTGFKFRWHCELTTNITIKRGSYLMYRRLY